MLLPGSDSNCLSELSLGFSYLLPERTKDANGVTVIHNAELLEVSVVRAGAQATVVSNVKAYAAAQDEQLRARLAELHAQSEIAELKARISAAARS